MVVPCARLLRVPGYVLGVVDFHGELVPLLDLPARLGLTAPRTPEALILGHIVFTELPSGLWGLAVDGVYDLGELPIALVLNPIQLISVVTRARIGDELAELAGGQL